MWPLYVMCGQLYPKATFFRYLSIYNDSILGHYLVIWTIWTQRQLSIYLFIYSNKPIICLPIFLYMKLSIYLFVYLSNEILTVWTYLEWNSVASLRNRRPGCVSTISWTRGTRSSGTRHIPDPPKHRGALE